jgi:Tfp pilus assembly protein PilE
MNLSRNKAITLIELLIAIVLLGVMTLAFSSIDLFSRYHLRTSEYRAKIHNELAYVLETITKDVVRATGDVSNGGIKYVSGTSFTVRIDTLGLVPTPGNYGDDTTITYALSGYQITRQGVSLNTQNIISSGGFGYTICNNTGCSASITSGLGIEVRLTGRYDPSKTLSAENPESKIKTKIYSQMMGG